MPAISLIPSLWCEASCCYASSKLIWLRIGSIGVMLFHSTIKEALGTRPLHILSPYLFFHVSVAFEVVEMFESGNDSLCGVLHPVNSLAGNDIWKHVLMFLPELVIEFIWALNFSMVCSFHLYVTEWWIIHGNCSKINSTLPAGIIAHLDCFYPLYIPEYFAGLENNYSGTSKLRDFGRLYNNLLFKASIKWLIVWYWVDNSYCVCVSVLSDLMSI